MSKIKVNVLANIAGHAIGETVMVDVDQDGTPTERFWRRRFRDAEKDHCVEIVSEKTKPKGYKSKEQEESTS